jgi:pyruvate dehydrogenase E2 component (dihydrolipoamide acetyltransferase)
MPDVVMPRLSDSMEEGTILTWLKASGEEVARGEEIVEIETDKATMTYESDAAGTLEIVAPEGATLPIGATIARVGGAGAAGAVPAADAPAAGAAAAAPAAAAPLADGPAAVAQAAAASAAVAPGAAAPAAVAERSAAAAQPAARVSASPVARRLARELGVELSALAGSGPRGRIVKADVAAAAGTPAAAAGTPASAAAGTPVTAAAPAPSAGAPSAVAASSAEPSQRGTTVVDLTRTQQAIARRMAESKATIPDYSVTTEVDMEAAVALRGQLKAAAPQGAAAPSFNDMVVKAAALALRDVPKANGAYRDGSWELYGRVNVGIAVATDDALIVPTVFDADRKALGEIAREARALAARVREGTITPPELSGATFTVSNLGMLGTTQFTAVIVPGQAAIMAVGALRDVPVVKDGQVVPGKRMSITITADHRILNGAEAAQLLARVRELLEQPVSLAF